MTVNERLFQLNTEFQKSYYAGNLRFFNIIVPEKFIEIKNYMFSVINDRHPLNNTIQDLTSRINKEMQEIEIVSKKLEASFCLKDHYINCAKNSVSQILWEFRQAISQYDSKILNDTIQVI